MSPTNTPDQSGPWGRLSRESSQAHQALLKYLELGERRSLSAVAAAIGKSEALVAKWSSSNSWGERARSFDEHRANVEQAARDEVLAAQGRLWERRRLEIADRDYALSSKLADRALAMLDWPLATEERDDGRTIVTPAKWNLGMASQLAKAASELGHSAVDTGTMDAELQSFDPTRASPEQAQALLDRLAARKKAVRTADAR